MESARAIKRVIRDVERQPWLENLSNFVEDNIVVGTYEKLGEKQWPLRNVLHGSIQGHPFHATISDVPTGAWATALVLDISDALLGNRKVGPGADTAIRFGLVGASLAAVSGLADWKHTKDETQHMGLVHGMVNLGAAGLYLTSLMLRSSGSRGLGQVVSSAGFGLTLAGAYLGGELVFDRHVAVTRAEEPQEPEEFTPIAAVDDLEDNTPYRFEVNEVPVVVVRQGDEFHALSDICAHLGRPLSGGTIHDGCITCPAHDSTYKLENGAVVHGPAAYPQPRFDVRVQNGYVEIRRPA